MGLNLPRTRSTGAPEGRTGRGGAAELTRPELRMPELVRGSAAHAHTVHSALVSLEALGVLPHRISIRRMGRDARGADVVVRQTPAAGEPLGHDVRVDLDVAGLGLAEALPVGMWESGGERTLGTREIVGGMDDPLEKLKHWFHEGAPLFRLSPEDRAASRRWLGLFGVDAAEWPEGMWYRLAALMSNVPQLSCSEEGCAFALGVLLGLPVRRVLRRAERTEVPEALLSRLGGRASRLGVDLLMGDSMEEVGAAELEIGPVALGVYERFAETWEGAALLRQVLDLLLPLGSRVRVRWLVEDRARAPQLGVAERNGRLGVNSHLGRGGRAAHTEGSPRTDGAVVRGAAAWGGTAAQDGLPARGAEDEGVERGAGAAAAGGGPTSDVAPDRLLREELGRSGLVASEVARGDDLLPEAVRSGVTEGAAGREAAGTAAAGTAAAGTGAAGTGAAGTGEDRDDA